MTWRRCSEEMPEPGTEVLVWLANNCGAAVAYLDKCGWYDSRNDDRPIRTRVLFWQPITPPDEDAQ